MASAKEVALNGCERAFEDAVAGLAKVLATETLVAANEDGKKMALGKFKDGIKHQKANFEKAVVAVNELL